MSFTSSSDIFVAIHEAGVNRVARRIMRNRPSLFNYGTASIASNPHKLCTSIDAAPEVIAGNNPIVTTVPLLPVIGLTGFLYSSIESLPAPLNYGIQLSKCEIDFSSGGIFPLPPELSPFPSQCLAVHLQACVGISCPKGLELKCFCLDFFAAVGCTIQMSLNGGQEIKTVVKGIEIVDLKPEELENSIECYAGLVLNDGILPPIMSYASRLAFALFTFAESTPDITVSGGIKVSASTDVPNNPAIEDDQLKVFVNLDTVDLNILISPGSGTPGSGTITRTVRPRTRTGPFDLTAAISENAFKKIYAAVIRGFRFSASGSGSYGVFTASYSVAAHLEGGSIDMRDTGSIVLSELDVKWDELSLTVGIDIPKITIGGFCIIPNIFNGGCAVRAPSLDLFTGSPDIAIPIINLSGLLTSEITLSVIPKVFYGVGVEVPNRWQAALVPTLPIDLDIIDIADTVGDLFHNLVVESVDNLLTALGLPDWAIDFIDFTLGGIEKLIRTLLDLPDDIGEFLLDLIGGLGIFQEIIDAIAKYIAMTLFEIEEMQEIMAANPAPTPSNAVAPLIAVKVPIDFLGIRVDTNEMILEGDIGE